MQKETILSDSVSSNNNYSNNNPTIPSWPVSLRDQIVRTFSRPINEAATHIFFDRHDWPYGLREIIFRDCKKVPLRFYVADDSGSMSSTDGTRIVKKPNGKYIPAASSRWAELRDMLLFIAEMSDCLGVTTQFQLLNGADPIIIGLNSGDGSLDFLREVVAEEPAGQTPLCTHIRSIVREVTAIADTLRARRQRVAVVIATDGESSDGNVAQALEPLINLPVFVVIRLCTNESTVIKYWDEIDGQLELDIDVLDDLIGEGDQVTKYNPWLTYTEHIHRLREFGSSMKELDMLDQLVLTTDQMLILCNKIFLNGKQDSLPLPAADWKEFLGRLEELNDSQPMVFCPRAKMMMKWINIKHFRRIYEKDNQRPDSSTACLLS